MKTDVDEIQEKSREEMIEHLESSIEYSKVLCKIAVESKAFTVGLTSNMEDTIDVIESRMYDADDDELRFFIRALRYEEIITGTNITDSKNQIRDFKPVPKPVPQGYHIPTPTSTLLDADESVEIIQEQIASANFPAKQGKAFMVSLAVAAEKLRMAIESGIESDIGTEQKATQSVINNIIEVIQTAKETVRKKKSGI